MHVRYNLSKGFPFSIFVTLNWQCEVIIISFSNGNPDIDSTSLQYIFFPFTPLFNIEIYINVPLQPISFATLIFFEVDKNSRK